jgi:hypothetical protein
MSSAQLIALLQKEIQPIDSPAKQAGFQMYGTYFLSKAMQINSFRSLISISFSESQP